APRSARARLRAAAAPAGAAWCWSRCRWCRDSCPAPSLRHPRPEVKRATLRRRPGAGSRSHAERILLGVGLELFAAGVGAEVVGLPFVLRLSLRLRLVEIHSANRICCHAEKLKATP